MNPTPIGWRNPSLLSPSTLLARLLGWRRTGASVSASFQAIRPHGATRSVYGLCLADRDLMLAVINDRATCVYNPGDPARRDPIYHAHWSVDDGIPGIEAITDPDEAVAFAIKALEARGVKP